MTQHVASGRPYPRVGEVFELTLGRETRRFKLVSVHCLSFYELTKILKEHGEIPESRWCEALKAAYPRPDDKGPIGIADSSRVPPNGDASLLFVHTGGPPSIKWPNVGFWGIRRWLVEVNE